MSNTAIIDATVTTVVSLQSFLGSGLPLSGDRSGDHPDQEAFSAPIPELDCSLDRRSSAVNTIPYQQVGTQILADMEHNKTTLIATQTDAINTARCVLNYSLQTLENYRPAARGLACSPIEGRQISDRLQSVVCGAVVRGAVAAFDSLVCTTSMDAARLRAMIVILAEVSRQLHAD